MLYFLHKNIYDITNEEQPISSNFASAFIFKRVKESSKYRKIRYIFCELLVLLCLGEYRN